jgi:hypothetical protein
MIGNDPEMKKQRGRIGINGRRHVARATAHMIPPSINKIMPGSSPGDVHLESSSFVKENG